MSRFPSISKAFKEVVEATETAIIADTSLNWGTLPRKVYFMSGNIKEITQRLTVMTQSPDPLISNGKYPLVALLKDIPETVTTIRTGYKVAFNARLLIITLTQPEYQHDQRRDINFIPVLEPILDKMLTVIGAKANFGMPSLEDMKLKKTNCYFYGSSINNKNQFNDYVDAIYVENLSLTLKENNHC